MLNVYKNSIRKYYNFTACPRSSIWDFKLVFSNWAIVWRHTNLFAKQIFIYFFFFFWFYRDCPVGSFKYPGNIYLFKLNNKHPRTRSKMYSTLVIKTIEQRQSRRSTIFIVNFEHIRHLVLVFPFLTWKR